MNEAEIEMAKPRRRNHRQLLPVETGAQLRITLGGPSCRALAGKAERLDMLMGRLNVQQDSFDWRAVNNRDQALPTLFVDNRIELAALWPQ